jgi:putative ABC transport system substrate-binding protein
MPELARALQSLNPTVFIVAASVLAVRALEPSTPVVFTAMALDPIEIGFAQSYVRPGGMITGNILNALGEDTKELVPALTRLGMFGFDVSIKPSLFEKELVAGRKVSTRFGFQTKEYGLKTIDDLEHVLSAALRDGIDGIYLSGDPLLINNLSRAMPLILQAGKPSVGTYVQFARAGVLMTYASDPIDGFTRAGMYAAKIIRGAKPGELPIEQPTKFTLALNSRTATALGLMIPATLLALADEVIE